MQGNAPREVFLDGLADDSVVRWEHDHLAKLSLAQSRSSALNRALLPQSAETRGSNTPAGNIIRENPGA